MLPLAVCVCMYVYVFLCLLVEIRKKGGLYDEELTY